MPELIPIYRQKLREQMQAIRENDPLQAQDLEHIYVALSVRVEAEERAIRETTDVIDIEESQKTIAALEAITEYPLLLIFGDPGSGKTTLLRHLAYLYAPAQTEFLPFFVRLHDFAARNLALIEYLAQKIREEHRLPVSAENIHHWFDQQRVLLLLDGLDEVNPNRRQWTLRYLNNELQTLPGVDHRICVTSRMSYHLASSDVFFASSELEDFQVAVLKPFDHHQIVEFIHRHVERDPQPLITQIEQTSSLHRLAQTPILLKIITIVYDQSPPDRTLRSQRTDLYADCVDLLLDRWNQQKQVVRLNRFPKGVRLRALAAMGFAAHLQQQRFISEEILAAAIKERLPDFVSRDILYEIAENSGILRPVAQAHYEFLHLTFQEYFAARAMWAMPAKVEVAVDSRKLAWWREAFLLYAEMANDATPLLEYLTQAKDNIFRSYLFLAGECLPRARCQREVRENIRRQLAKVHKKDRYRKLREIAGQLLKAELNG
ncbi:MAG: NACHT domain-containing protein [Gemmatimonadetes bacterium]|nr:MAG: NACHT domain-containing protein [Gemmatimonadota bacterium]